MVDALVTTVFASGALGFVAGLVLMRFVGNRASNLVLGGLVLMALAIFISVLDAAA